MPRRFGKCKMNPRLLLSITGADTDKLQAIYWNWTTKEAHDFHIEIDQEFEPGHPPPEPKIDAPPFKEGKSEHTDKEVGEGEEKRIRRHIVYKFKGAAVSPGGQVKIKVTGAKDADHLVVIWTDKDGKEIDRSKTADGMMGRGTFTQNPPKGANDFHLEYKDVVGGIWVEQGKATPKITVTPGEKYPYGVDFDNISPPFDFSIDFASDSTGKQIGPRDGRFWWTKDHARVGKITESG